MFAISITFIVWFLYKNWNWYGALVCIVASLMTSLVYSARYDTNEHNKSFGDRVEDNFFTWLFIWPMSPIIFFDCEIRKRSKKSLGISSNDIQNDGDDIDAFKDFLQKNSKG
jgi:hypothetical protein